MYTFEELYAMDNSYEKTASYDELGMEEMQKAAFDMGVEYGLGIEKEAGLSRGAKAGLAALGLAGAGAGAGYAYHKNVGDVKHKVHGALSALQARYGEKEGPITEAEANLPFPIQGTPRYGISVNLPGEKLDHILNVPGWVPGAKQLY